MAHLGFDATQVQPDTGQLDPIPAGWYNAMVDESELKPTSDGLGARLAVRFNIIDGQYANRKIYTGFNIRNTNPVAQEIAFKQLSALAHAVGVLQVQDSQQLHGIPLKIRVKIRPPQNGYEAQNDISAYKDVNYSPDSKGGDASAPAAPAGMGAPAAPAGFGTAAPPAAPAAAPAAGGAGWGGAPAQPWQQPGASAPAAASAPPPFTPPAPPAPAAADFPPAGWTAHPTAAGYFYKDQEVLSEADLRAKTATLPPAPAAPPAPPAAQAAPAAPAGPDPATTAQVATPPWQQPKA